MILEVLGRVVNAVWTTFLNVWPFLLLSIVLAAALATYVGTDRLADWLRRRTTAAVAGAVALATLTPFCSCGTTAVVLGALASHVPWAPVVAFMVSSPLTSPEEYVLSAGLFGLPFASTFFVAAIVLGLLAGAVTFVVERTGWLAGQARMKPSPGGSCEPASECSGRTSAVGVRQRLKPDAFARELLITSRRLALFFFGFAAIGYLLIEAIPTQWLTEYLGGDSPLAVPVAALLGIPVYLNTDGSLPLVAALMKGGMGPGPALAFLVTGAGTSIGAISGMLLIARRRVVGLVVGLLFAGAVMLGWAAPLWL
jgi:uncharacterized protein